MEGAPNPLTEPVAPDDPIVAALIEFLMPHEDERGLRVEITRSTPEECDRRILKDTQQRMIDDGEL